MILLSVSVCLRVLAYARVCLPASMVYVYLCCSVYAECSAHHMAIAKELMHTCNEFYVRSPTGLAPEIIFFKNGK